MPFLARPAPLPIMATGGEPDKHPWHGDPSHDSHQPPFRRAKKDIAPGRASSSTQWGFTLRRRLPRLASCHSADLRLLTGVGLLLLQMWWQRRCWSLSYGSSSLPGRGSCIARKASSLCGRMDWWLSRVPLGVCAQNVMPGASKLRLPSRTTLFGHTPLVPGLNNLSTYTERWRCKRRCWQRCRCMA
jgi:hypothetical protein